MGAAGTVELDFGAHPGSTHTTVAVTGQTGIVSGSEIDAWIMPVATTDHSADEHMLEAIQIFARDIVPGTGFTVHGVDASINTASKPYGKFNVGWVWA